MDKKWELSKRVKAALVWQAAFSMMLIFCTAVMFLSGADPAAGCLALCVFLAVFMISLFVIYCYLVKPYRRTRKLIDAFNKGIIFEEIFHLPYTFCPESGWMMEKLHLLFQSEEMLKLSVEQSRYLALQNQINPHFLYNTLDAIRADALEAGILDVAKTAEALSAFFGYSISNLEKYAMLAEELENVKDYMSIQQYRFGDKLNLSIENKGSSEVFTYMIPRMTLQPLVENAIYHGLEGKSKMGTVSVRIQDTNQMLIVNVVDNGVGMCTTAVDKLNASMNRAEAGYTEAGQKKGGIALKNVNSRIKLLFGEDYGLHVFSEPGVGTDVRIRIPIVKKESLDERRISEN